jgi:hypothetical protein
LQLHWKTYNPLAGGGLNFVSAEFDQLNLPEIIVGILGSTRQMISLAILIRYKYVVGAFFQG